MHRIISTSRRMQLEIWKNDQMPPWVMCTLLIPFFMPPQFLLTVRSHINYLTRSFIHRNGHYISHYNHLIRTHIDSYREWEHRSWKQDEELQWCASPTDSLESNHVWTFSNMSRNDSQRDSHRVVSRYENVEDAILHISTMSWSLFHAALTLPVVHMMHESEHTGYHAVSWSDLYNTSI